MKHTLSRPLPSDRRNEVSARDFWLAGVVLVVMLGLLTLWAWAISKYMRTTQLDIDLPLGR